MAGGISVGTGCVKLGDRAIRGTVVFLALMLYLLPHNLWANDFLRSDNSSPSAKGCADFLSLPQGRLMESLGVVILPEVGQISEVAVHVAESFRLQTYAKARAGEAPLALRDLFKSLRISNRKFLEFKNAVLERSYLSESALVHSDFQWIQQDLEYWLEHLSNTYLSELLRSLEYALQGEGRQVTLRRSLSQGPVLEQIPWASRDWTKYSFQDEMHSFHAQFWVVEGELPSFVDGLGLFYLQELQVLVEQVKLAIEGHIRVLPLLARYSQYVAGLHGQERARQSEELFVTAGLVHERMGQILDRALGPEGE